MINNEWDNILKDEYNKDYFKNLMNFVNEEYKNKICFPQYNDIFNALKYTSFNDVKVVILGQDPYHGEKEAHGLSFSVNDYIKCPSSLNNIFKELYNDLGIKKVNNNLIGWSKQGVLLLNSILTVEKDKPLSHKNKGWEIFTDKIIEKLNERQEKIIFVLWGNYARSKKKLITNHIIIESAHPSGLSANRGFFGSKPFSQINMILEKNNKEKIDWSK